MLSFLKSWAGGLKMNFHGDVRIQNKVIVIESDDWGAIRTPSAGALEAFASQHFELEKSIYKVDALASTTDLNVLFDLLSSHRNINGQHPAITANAIMANPDFDKIEASGFSTYHYEPFTHTFHRYPEHQDNLAIWHKAEAEGLFIPEYHGREHLNINRWLKRLQSGDERLRYAYEWQSTYSGQEDYAFMEAYDWDTPQEVAQHKKILREGAAIFEATFGRKPNAFIAPCYNWDPKLEQTISELGIKWIQGISAQLAPTGAFNRYNPIKHYFGKGNGFGSRYNIRNVYFEPVNNPDLDWTDRAMARIYAAFLLQKPAVISTHRVNYIGFIAPRNRDNGLRHLDRLLKAILKKWPEVEFITTAQLSNYFKHNEYR
jgi:hypothetical protein